MNARAQEFKKAGLPAEKEKVRQKYSALEEQQRRTCEEKRKTLSELAKKTQTQRTLPRDF